MNTVQIKLNTEFKAVPTTVTESGYIDSAVERGIISAFPNKTFQPNAPGRYINQQGLVDRN